MAHHTPHQRPSLETASRRDFHASSSPFAISAFAVILLVALIALCTYIVYFRISSTGAGTGLVNKLSTSGTITTYTVIVLFSAAVAGGVGALAYFLSRRSAAAANTAICGVLLLANGVMAYSLYNNMQVMQNAKQRAATPSPTPAPTTTTPAPLPRIVPPVPPQQPPRPSVTLPSTSDPASPTRTKPADEPKHASIAPTIEKLRAEFDADAESLAKAVIDGFALFNKAPAHDRADLTKRLNTAAALATTAEALATRFRSAREEALQQLTAAGVPDDQARTAAAAFATDGSYFMRAAATGRISFACDAARDEAQLLTDNFTNWRVAAGQLDSKDPAIKGRLRGARNRTEAQTRDPDAIAQTLRGKQ